MKYSMRFILLVLLLAILSGCQMFSQDKKPDLQPAHPDSNLASKDTDTPYTTVYAPPKPLDKDHPAQVERQPEVAMLTPSKPPVAPVPEKLPSGKYRLRSVLVVGDSFAVGIGMSLSKLLKSYDDIALYAKGKTSSGLNSTKFYNWQEKLPEYLKGDNPDALVVMISGNDAHNGSGSESWARSYESKMGDFLASAVKYGVPVYLVGLPPMGKEDYSERARVANQAIKNACSKTSDCEYVDVWPLFSDDKGAFTREKNIGGAPKTLRGKDGVHFTMTGYYLLGNAILDKVGNRFELDKHAAGKQATSAKVTISKKTASAP